MKLDKKVKWLLVVCGCSLMIATVWISCFLKQSESKETSLKYYRFKNEKAKNDSEWMRYQEIRNKISGLTRGWKKPANKLNPNANFDLAISINDSVAKQIIEIERIHEEEILGKLSETNRIYHEYRQKLLRDLDVKFAEKSKTIKTKLEADLASEKKRQMQAMVNFRKDLERKQQLTLINLVLQKKMIAFNSVQADNQQSESERIELEIARIRSDIKKKIDKYGDDLEKEFKLYQKQKKAESQVQLSELRKENQKLAKTELSRFRDEQMNEFKAWNNQRQTDVEQAIELRRFQK